MSGQGVEVEILLTVITGPGETPASVHAEVNAGTVLTAGPLTDHPEVPVLQTGGSLELTGVPEQSSQSPDISPPLVSPVSFPIRATDLALPSPGTVSAPLSRAGEPLAGHCQAGPAGLEDRLPGVLREGPRDGPRDGRH